MMRRPNTNPLDLDGEAMPIEVFRDLYRVPGYKYEYTEGRVDISIQRSAQAVVAAPVERILEHTQPSVPEKIEACVAKETSIAELETLWVDTFIHSPDYHRATVEDVRKSARKSLTDLYGEPPSLHPASRVAKRKGELVGALLINKSIAQPLIEVIFIRRDLRRRGLAQALIHQAAQELDSTGRPSVKGGHAARGGSSMEAEASVDDESDRDPPAEEAQTSRQILSSGYLLANQNSAAWHHALGFIELPSWLVLTHRYRCLEHNLKQGLVDDIFWAKRRAEKLQAELNRMREKRQQDAVAYSPVQWLVSDGERIERCVVEALEGRKTLRSL